MIEKYVDMVATYTIHYHISSTIYVASSKLPGGYILYERSTSDVASSE